MTIIALIVAAGSGSRTGLNYPKQFMTFGKTSVLNRVVENFSTHPDIDHVQVIINPEDTDLYLQTTEGQTLLPWIAGDVTRQGSVRNGLAGIKNLQPIKVLIHDAARPFFSHDLIDRCLAALKDLDAVLPALSVTDTLKQINGRTVVATVDRSEIVAAQTPQCFNYDKIHAAHIQFADSAVTDDIALAELAGIPVHWIKGEADNIKITTEEDIRRINASMLSDIRTGMGYDVHAFADNRDLWLGGVKIDYEKGLKGHSDADVALHALTDAILGAIGAGDIGTHFPPTDDKWKDVSSDRFLAHAASLVSDMGGVIGNVDLTIICEAPKIGPHRNAMRYRIGQILNVEEGRISIKGTTTEKLGFTGRKEGIAAQAIATVRLPQ